MPDITNLIQLVQSHLKTGQPARISEEKIADAVSASPDQKQYSLDMKASIERMCNENGWIVRQDFDTGDFIFEEMKVRH